MIAGVLASIGAAGFKFIGGHLLGGGPVQKLEAAVSGLGMRFAIGFGSAFYILNPAFRAGADQCIKAILEALKGLV